MNTYAEPEPALIARHDGEARQWDFGTGLPPGPAGVTPVPLTGGLVAYVDLADPGALPSVTVDEPIDDEPTRDAVTHWLGAEARRVLDHHVAPVRLQERVLVPPDAAGRLRTVARPAALARHAELDRLRGSSRSPWWELEQLVVDPEHATPAWARAAADAFLASPARARTTEGARLLSGFADAHLRHDAPVATSLRGRTSTADEIVLIDDENDDLRLLDTFAVAARAHFDVDAHATVVVDPITAPESVTARDFALHWNGAHGRLSVALRDGSPTGTVWLRIYDADRHLVALEALTHDGGDRLTAELPLNPAHELGELRYDVTDSPESPPPTDAGRATWIAAVAGAWATSAERAGDPGRAARLWNACADRWDAFGDVERAAIARSYYADALDAAGHRALAVEHHRAARGQYLGWSWRRLLQPRASFAPFVAELERAAAAPPARG